MRALSKVNFAAPRSIAALKQQFEPRIQPALRVLEQAEIDANARAQAATLEAYDLTDAEKFALLHMGDAHRSQAIWHRLREQFSCPPFTLSTFVALRERGLAYLPEGRRFHMLSAEGLKIEPLVADDVQKTHNVHAPYLLGRTRATVSMRCTCGWSCALRAGDRMQEKAARMMTKHLQELAAHDDLRTALVPVCMGETET